MKTIRSLYNFTLETEEEGMEIRGKQNDKMSRVFSQDFNPS